ncbi:MAG: AraC family transcriptional regulator ligand-binding domain-containing protein [Pseudorhodoplanes sp.]|nr:AraC family transcriptional regulator ligand-binding domain-containing protein [Pseudorhodoplanes sp.]
MDARAAIFEDIHEVAVRLAARKLTPSQRRQADRNAKRLSLRATPQQAALKPQLYWIAYFNEAATLAGDDCFGCHLGQHTDTRELGIIHYIFAASATALDAVKNLIRYSQLVNSMTSLSLDETDRQVTIEVRFRLGLEGFQRHIAEWGPTTIVAALRHLTGTHLVPRAVNFVHQRTSGIKTFEAFFGCPVRFGANRQGITFARAALLAPIRTADRYLLDILTSVCEEALRKRKVASTPTRARVEAALLEHLPHGKACLGVAAKSLHMSPRSLARRLAEEGTTYAETLEHLRRDLAMHYLEDSRVGVSQIAWLLGYSEVTSFNHAFRRWTSRSPKEVRAGLMENKPEPSAALR